MDELLMRRRAAVDIKSKGPSFGGLMIAPGPLIYENGAFCISPDPYVSSYNSIYGKNEGSTYFSFVELGQYFDSRGSSFGETNGNINNNGSKISFDGYNDWRLPTRAELLTITLGTSPGQSRAGSTVNGDTGSKFVKAYITDKIFMYSNPGVYGLLLFPDNKTIDIYAGGSSSAINNTSYEWKLTFNVLQRFIDQGCVFIPYIGCKKSTSSWDNGMYLHWLSATSNSNYSGSASFYSLYHYYNQTLSMTTTNKKSSSYLPVYLVRNI